MYMKGGKKDEAEQSKMVEEKGRSYSSLLLTAFPAESSKMGLLEGTPIYLF